MDGSVRMPSPRRRKKDDVINGDNSTSLKPVEQESSRKRRKNDKDSSPEEGSERQSVVSNGTTVAQPVHSSPEVLELRQHLLMAKQAQLNAEQLVINTAQQLLNTESQLREAVLRAEQAEKEFGSKHGGRDEQRESELEAKVTDLQKQLKRVKKQSDQRMADLTKQLEEERSDRRLCELHADRRVKDLKKQLKEKREVEKQEKRTNKKSRNGKKTEVERGFSGSHASAALKQTASTVLGGTNLSKNASPTMNPAASSAVAQARIAVPYRAELMKKSLRERVIHIVITARYKSFEAVIARLRKDGLPPEQDSKKAIEDLLKEVSESSESGRVFLKQCFRHEVNLKWKWLSTEETDYIRKLQNPQNLCSTSFTPSRKSGVDRVMAPSATLNTSTPSSANSDGM